MNKWAKAKPKQFWGALIGAGAGILGGMMSNKQSEENQGTSFEQTQILRNTAYQATVDDLKKAGLNPMLAYGNGANSAQAMPVAQNRNVMEGVANSAASIAQLENIEAQNDLLKAQAQKAIAEAEAIPTSTANVQQQTRNLEAMIPKIEAEIKQMKMQTRTEEERVILTRAQKFLAETQEKLAAGQIENTEAQTATQKVLTLLKQLEVPGAKNIADYEKALGTGVGNAATIGGKIIEKIPAMGKIKGIITNSARKAAK